MAGSAVIEMFSPNCVDVGEDCPDLELRALVVFLPDEDEPGVFCV